MRNTAKSVKKLSYLAAFGLRLGKLIKGVLQRDLQRHKDDPDLNEDDAWVNAACRCIGSDTLKPPPAAVA